MVVVVVSQEFSLENLKLLQAIKINSTLWQHLVPEANLIREYLARLSN